MRLILFDIDGTLLRCGKQVAQHFLGALETVFGGYRLPERFSFAGKTDPMIAVELLRGLGLDEEEIHARLPRARDLYVAAMDRELDRDRMLLLPGVVELLERLVLRPELTVGLLTGNWQGGARAKLSRFDLEAYFAFGAFGDDARDRRGLVPVALRRAETHGGGPFAPEDVLIVGDTVLDVDCARAAGARCLAVASGFTEAEELEAAGADWVFDDLQEAARRLDLFA
ncbi:MAG: HAD hydrolase-like protein [Thermoanaerobaculia bacterium]|nr:HAD hydrolase-like protein [Thermoanaerobaculia bacterium]